MANKKALFRAGRDRAVDELLLLQQQGVDLDGTLFAVAAESCGYSVRQLRRMLKRAAAEKARAEMDPSQSTAEDQDKGAWLRDPDVHNEIALCGGNLEKAYSRLQKTKKLPSLSTFKRRINADYGTFKMTVIRGSEMDSRARRVHLKREPGARCHTYETDHTECPVYVIPTGHKRAVRPYATVVIDRATRLVLSVVITFGKRSAEEVRVAFIAAIRTRTAPDGHTMIGGLPLQMVWDQGKEYLSTLVTESCLRVGTTPNPLPAYSPHLKGRCERFWRFFKENCLVEMPGYIDAGEDVRGTLHRAQYALSEVAFIHRVTEWVDWYNCEHVHSSLGMTPLQAWQADTRDLVVVPDDQLWCDFLLADHTAVVGTSGVCWKKSYYVTLDGELDQLIGKNVEVRYLPHMRDFIEVFHDGVHVGTAYRADLLTPDNIEAFLKQRKADEARARKSVSSVKRIHKQDPNTQKLTKKKLPGGKFVYEVDVPADDDLRTGQSKALDRYRPRTDRNDGFDDNGQGVLL